MQLTSGWVGDTLLLVDPEMVVQSVAKVCNQLQKYSTYKLLRSFCALSFQTASRLATRERYQCYSVPTIEYIFVVQLVKCHVECPMVPTIQYSLHNFSN